MFFGVRAAKGTPKKDTTPQVSLETFTNADTGFSFSYDRAALSVGQLSDKDAKERIIFRATESATAEAPLLVTARYEKGLRTVASVSRMDPVDIVLDGAERSLPRKFPGFYKVSSTKFEQGSNKAAELVYTYKGPSGEVIKQKLYVLIKDGDIASYITVQSKESDFDTLNKKYFDSLLKSAKFE